MVLVRTVFNDKGRVLGRDLFNLMREFEEIINPLDFTLVNLRTVTNSNIRFQVEHIKKRPYHTLAYENQDNWYIEHDDNDRPYAKNVYSDTIKHPIKRLRFLQTDDWVKFNDAINKFFDDKELLAHVESCKLVIRDQKDKDWRSRWTG